MRESVAAARVAEVRTPARQKAAARAVRVRAAKAAAHTRETKQSAVALCVKGACRRRKPLRSSWQTGQERSLSQCQERSWRSTNQLIAAKDAELCAEEVELARREASLRFQRATEEVIAAKQAERAAVEAARSAAATLQLESNDDVAHRDVVAAT